MPFELIVQDAMASVRLSDGRVRDLKPGTHIYDEADMAVLRGRRQVVQVWVDQPSEPPKPPEPEAKPAEAAPEPAPEPAVAGAAAAH